MKVRLKAMTFLSVKKIYPYGQNVNVLCHIVPYPVIGALRGITR